MVLGGRWKSVHMQYLPRHNHQAVKEELEMYTYKYTAPRTLRYRGEFQNHVYIWNNSSILERGEGWAGERFAWSHSWVSESTHTVRTREHTKHYCIESHLLAFKMCLIKDSSPHKICPLSGHTFVQGRTQENTWRFVVFKFEKPTNHSRLLENMYSQLQNITPAETTRNKNGNSNPGTDCPSQLRSLSPCCCWFSWRAHNETLLISLGNLVHYLWTIILTSVRITGLTWG